MSTITTTDGREIFFRDWGSEQPIVFSHGWPLSGDDRDTQMLFFLHNGYRVVAHLDPQDAVHVGHSTGGGEVVRYIARHGESRVAKAVLISSAPPLKVQVAATRPLSALEFRRAHRCH